MMHKPLHPGEIVRDALFEATEQNITEAAKQLKTSRGNLSRLLNGHVGISADMAYRLAAFLETSPKLWMNLQKDYELWSAKDCLTKLNIVPLRKLGLKE